MNTGPIVSDITNMTTDGRAHTPCVRSVVSAPPEPPARLLPEKAHQRLTVEDFVELRTLAPDLQIIPSCGAG
jgi:hypothetical protein